MTPEGLVQRRRLFDLLSGGPRLRVVAAPSGFGKTTLLRSWADARPPASRRVVWVALGGEVGTRREFWQLVATSTVRSDVGHPGVATTSATIDVGDDPLTVIAEVLGAKGPTTLVIDAYENLRGLTGEIDDDLLRLLAAVPGLDIVVTTRASTKLTDDVLAIRGVVRMIGESDLRFTSDEVEQLLAMHAPHALGAAERIVRDTHGYPLAVRAAAFALERSGSVPSFASTAWRRLVGEDLQSQIVDPKLIDFVLDTSVPPYFDRELAEQLAGVDDADAALAELAWNGFGRWIPYARDRPAFQYVESVRDVFRGRLRADHPDRYERDAGLAASWLYRHDEHDLALDLAIDGRRFGLASRICDRMSGTNPDIFTTDLFERHLRRVPRASLQRYPMLAFARAFAYTTNPATRDSAAEYFRLAAAHALDGVDEMSPGEEFTRRVGLVVALRHLGRAKESAAAAIDALECFESLPPGDRDGLTERLPMALSTLAYSLFQYGDLDRASTLVDRAATAAVVPWWKNYALGFAVGIHALDGRRPEARDALAMIDPDAWSSGYRRRVPHVLGVTGDAALRLDEFDFTGALHAFEGAEWLLDVAESWPFITWVTMHAQLGLGRSGSEAHRVAAALATKPPRPGLGPNLATAALSNALAILWLASGQASKGRPLLRMATPCPGQLAPARLLYQLVSGDPALAVRELAELQVAAGHTVRSAAAVETLGAAAALRAGNDLTARELLERAAARYQVFGVRVQLMYLPGSDLRALRDLASGFDLAACEDYLSEPVATPITDAGHAPVQLTRRELDVLRAWARHRTRVEVANALFVSPNTVKTQLSSAYRKLGVTTKDAAIQRAIELDLLRPPDAP
jgi:LuxR family maltose regulon positive regulatory protein